MTMSRGVSRRGLLASGAALLAVGAGGGLSLALGPPAPGALVLSDRELRVVGAAAEAMFPGAPLPLDGIQAAVAARVDEIVADLMDPLRRAAFRYVLRVLEVGTMARRGRPFSALPVHTRQVVLERWSEPEVVPRRVAGDSLRAVLGMAYFSHPDVLASIGWERGCGGGA